MGEGEREEAGFHVKARLFSYPGAKGPRFPVPEEKVPWEVTATFLIIMVIINAGVP